VMTDIKPATSSDVATIRRRYERMRAPFCSTSQARTDVLTLLAERREVRRAAEKLMMAALPYSGDPALNLAIEGFRAAIEGRQPSS